MSAAEGIESIAIRLRAQRLAADLSITAIKALLRLWKKYFMLISQRAAVLLSGYECKFATVRLSTLGSVPELGNVSLCHCERHFTPIPILA